MLLHSSRLPPPRALAGRRLPLGGCARLCAPAVLPSALQPPQHRPSRRDALCSLAVLGAGAASARGARASAFASEVEAATAAAEAAFTPPTRVTAPGRVVAIGDLHGDMAQALRALALAGVVGLDPDGSNRAVWTGGNTTLVQLGDILDRGDEEIGILFLLQQLAEGAEAAGGAVYVLNGNHEVLNVSGDFSYVTLGAFGESARFGRRIEEMFGVTVGPPPFETPEGAPPPSPEALALDAAARTRLGLFSPGGFIAQQLARHPTVLVVNDTVFAHGGLLPSHVQYGLEALNASVSRWMRGEASQRDTAPLRLATVSKDSVMWNRSFGREVWSNPAQQYTTCAMLRQALAMVPGASRLVVGHTPQRGGCNSACDGAVWRVDVGLSRGVFGAGAQVLEIDGDRVRVLGVATGPRGAAAVAIAAAEEEARSRTGEEAGGGDSEEAGEEEGEAEKKAAV